MQSHAASPYGNLIISLKWNAWNSFPGVTPLFGCLDRPDFWVFNEVKHQSSFYPLNCTNMHMYDSFVDEFVSSYLAISHLSNVVWLCCTYSSVVHMPTKPVVTPIFVLTHVWTDWKRCSWSYCFFVFVVVVCFQLSLLRKRQECIIRCVQMKTVSTYNNFLIPALPVSNDILWMLWILHVFLCKFFLFFLQLFLLTWQKCWFFIFMRTSLCLPWKHVVVM